MHFFDRHKEFYDEPAVGNARKRLCARYDAIIAPNREIFNGARVLDIAAHDGRMSLAAIRSGAKYVLGVEGRQNMVDKGLDIFQKYILSRQKYDLLKFDVENEQIQGEFDVALILGFLYHTRDQYKILEKVAKTGVKHMIIDTAIYKSDYPVASYRQESTDSVGLAIGEQPETYVSVPSLNLLKMFLCQLGFTKFVMYDWHSQNIEDWTDIKDYEKGIRVTFVAERTSA